jgi:hypothetical protein
MIFRAVWILSVLVALAACAAPPPRSLATASLTETFALTSEICGKLVPAVLRGDEQAVDRIARVYGVDNRRLGMPNESGWPGIRAATGYGDDIRGIAPVGHSLFRDEKRVHYRISYFKEGETRSQLMWCRISEGDGHGLAVSYHFVRDRDVLRGVIPEQQPAMERNGRT